MTGITSDRICEIGTYQTSDRLGPRVAWSGANFDIIEEPAE